MKTLVILLFALSWSISLLAESDLARGLEWVANAASLGSYLPDLEGEKKKIDLEGQRRQAQLLLELEQHSNERLANFYRRSVNQSKERAVELNRILEEAQAIQRGYADLQAAIQQLSITVQSNQLSLQQIQTQTDSLSGLQRIVLSIILGEPPPASLAAECEQAHRVLACTVVRLQGLTTAVKDRVRSQKIDEVRVVLGQVYRLVLEDKRKFSIYRNGIQDLLDDVQMELKVAESALSGLETNPEGKI